jgi:uncharacterized protein YxjI
MSKIKASSVEEPFKIIFTVSRKPAQFIIQDCYGITLGFIKEGFSVALARWIIKDKNHIELGLLKKNSFNNFWEELKGDFKREVWEPSEHSISFDLIAKNQNIGKLDIRETASFVKRRKLIVNLSNDTTGFFDRRLAIALAILVDKTINFGTA